MPFQLSPLGTTLVGRCDACLHSLLRVRGSLGPISCGATSVTANAQLTVISNGGSLSLGSLSSTASSAGTVLIAPTAPILLTTGPVTGTFVLSLGGSALITWDPVSYDSRPLTLSGSVNLTASINPTTLTLNNGLLRSSNVIVSAANTLVTSGGSICSRYSPPVVAYVLRSPRDFTLWLLLLLSTALRQSLSQESAFPVLAHLSCAPSPAASR
jgi:hypothetical protein